MNGVIIIDKPKGKTSHDIVGILRKKFGTRKVGHTGTLDPLATGVLPVCIGNATRAADMLLSGEKKYRATMILGKRSDTLDVEGKITEEKAVTVTQQQVRDVIAGFVGEQDQIPPMYSAIKKDGKKLYDLAREGIEVERKARRINIYSIDVVDISLPEITIDVHCSKGTYIRSLCDDIGTRLGCGAVMSELRRTYTAGFSIDEAYTIDELDNIPNLSGTLKPTDSLFSDFPEIHLNEKQEKSITNGVRMTWRSGKEGETYRVYAPDGRFLCISRLEDMRLVLVKSFWS
ncbi:MAG: tRNA pseudouridine(55) synthase TruB [Clostridia bacterium]|nr:tRNA pseudouridine(55) synthase TruB [Clostridia bacterium]